MTKNTETQAVEATADNLNNKHKSETDDGVNTGLDYNELIGNKKLSITKTLELNFFLNLIFSLKRILRLFYIG